VLTPDTQNVAQTRSVRLCRTLLLGFSFAILAQFAIAQELKNSVETS
jgi:hypothetical protein